MNLSLLYKLVNMNGTNLTLWDTGASRSLIKYLNKNIFKSMVRLIYLIMLLDSLNFWIRVRFMGLFYF